MVSVDLAHTHTDTVQWPSIFRMSALALRILYCLAHHCTHLPLAFGVNVNWTFPRWLMPVLHAKLEMSSLEYPVQNSGEKYQVIGGLVFIIRMDT